MALPWWQHLSTINIVVLIIIIIIIIPNATYVAFGGYFRAFPFPALPYPPYRFHSLPLLLPSHMSHDPSSSSPKRWTRNLSIGTERAQHHKNTNAVPSANIYCFYPYVSLYWPDTYVMFSTCPFVCPFVRSFVCYRLVNVIYFEDEWTDSMQLGINLSRGKGANGRPRGQEVKGQGHRRLKLDLEVCRIHHSRLLGYSRLRHSKRRKCVEKA